MDVDYTSIGRLLSSPARSAMLGVLFDGGQAGATELARRAGVAPSTASGHLRALVDGGLVTVTAHGRHRRYRLAGAEIAEALEALGRVCPRVAVDSLQAHDDATSLSFARTCYDHLAGDVGVAVLVALLDGAWLVPARDGYALGPAGRRFAELGIDVDALAARRRPLARPCLTRPSGDRIWQVPSVARCATRCSRTAGSNEPGAGAGSA